MVFGAPGAGKGTLAEKIKRLTPVVHISTGDLLRESVRSGGELGRRARAFMDEGRLVPDELVIAMVRERLSMADARERGFLLDGFPRTVEQARALDEISRVDAVLVIDISKDELKRRILGRRSCPRCGRIYNIFNKRLMPVREGVCDGDGERLIQRDDDNEETFEKRWSTYLSQSGGVIEYYSRRPGLVRRVDGARTMELGDDELRRLLE
ncbi:MAG: adenylate kinase family protein [Thermoplasmatota archaeon]